MSNKKRLAEGAKFHEALASAWSSSYEAGGFKRRIAFFEALLEQHVRAGELWLDAGCGSGRLARAVTQFGARVVAIDGSPAMIDCARSESVGFENAVSYKLIDTIETLDFPPSSFDKALSSSVLEYVDDPKKALSELFKVIKPGGILIVSVPNRFSLVRLGQQALRAFLRVLGRDPFPYLAVSKNDYSRLGLECMVRDIGFGVEGVGTFDPMLPEFIARNGLGSLFVATLRKPAAD